MNPIHNPNPNQLDPFLLPPSIPYLENPNPTFTTLPFADYVSSPLPPLLPTYNNSTYGDPSHSHSLAFPYPIPDNPLGLVKREDGIGFGIGIGLNLGQRTYFNTTRSLFGFGAYGSGQNLNPPRCQVDGCKTDLTGAKHYHRRHKVCEFHSKAPMVSIGGLQQRFCQQCSRFHVVAEFDEAKRSCRKRLADHNRRRRKPQFPSDKDPNQASHKIKSSTSTTSAPTKPTNDTSSITNNSATSMSSTSCNLENSHAKVQNKLQTYEKLNGTSALSLGEVAKLDSSFSNQSLNIYHEQHQGSLPFATLAEEKQSFYHHQNTFASSSSSNKAQELFEVDFM